jgi:hypothetical protein
MRTMSLSLNAHAGVRLSNDEKILSAEHKGMPNIPPLVTHMTGDDFGGSPSGRPLFLQSYNVSGGVVTGGVTSLNPVDQFTSVTNASGVEVDVGDLTIRNLGILTLSAGAGINITGSSGNFTVDLSAVVSSTNPFVFVTPTTPYTKNAGTSISYTNFPSQTAVPLLTITSASAYNYCEFNYYFVPTGNPASQGLPPRLVASNDVNALFSFYMTPSLGLAHATALSNNWNETNLPGVANEGNTYIPYGASTGTATSNSFSSEETDFPPQKITAWSPTPSTTWYFAGYNSSANALPVPYIDWATSTNIAVNAFLWNVDLS